MKLLILRSLGSLAWSTLIIGGFGCASPEQRVARHVEAAARMIADYHYGRAWRELEQARKIGVQSPQVDALQGMMMTRRGNFEAAERLLTSALNGMPENHAARNNLAVIYLATGRAPEAVRLLEPSFKSGTRFSSLLNNYGVALRVCGHRERAREVFGLAMRANPRNADATANYAMCLYLNKKYREAVAAWETATYIEAGNPEAWAGVCIGREALGEAGKAREAAFRTVVTDSSYVNQKILVERRHWPPDAAARLSRVIRSIPRFRQGQVFSPMMVKAYGAVQFMEDPLIDRARKQLARR